MADTMESLKRKAIVSLNDSPGMREMFDGLRMETIGLKYTIGQAAAGPKGLREVLIYNFDMPDEGLWGLL